MLIQLMRPIQFFRDRFLSMAAVATRAIPPIFWLYISWKATGNWLACFVARREYHDWLFAANPTLAHFSLPHILRDGATLLLSADLAVLMGAFAAGWFVIKPLARRAGIPQEVRAIVPALVFLFATMGMIFAAYLSGAMPIIFPRYALILFTLRLPILAWA